MASQRTITSWGSSVNNVELTSVFVPVCDFSKMCTHSLAENRTQGLEVL